MEADRVREGFTDLLSDDCGYIALASNTHDLLVRFLPGLNYSSSSKIITTDSEFHTVRRQLNSLDEKKYIILLRFLVMWKQM